MPKCFPQQYLITRDDMTCQMAYPRNEDEPDTLHNITMLCRVNMLPIYKRSRFTDLPSC
jgi:hypothetical protein